MRPRSRAAWFRGIVRGCCKLPTSLRKSPELKIVAGYKIDVRHIARRRSLAQTGSWSCNCVQEATMRRKAFLPARLDQITTALPRARSSNPGAILLPRGLPPLLTLATSTASWREESLTLRCKDAYCRQTFFLRLGTPVVIFRVSSHRSLPISSPRGCTHPHRVGGSPFRLRMDRVRISLAF